MMDLAGKYLKKKEVEKFSQPDFIRKRIEFLMEVSKLVDRQKDNLKCELVKMYSEINQELLPSFHLLGHITLDLFSYYNSVRRLFPQKEYKDILKFPIYYDDGTLKVLRHVFGHLEKDLKESLKSIRSFEKEHGDIRQMAGDFVKFDKIVQKVISEHNTKLILERISEEDKEIILGKFPKSRIANLL